MPVHVQVFSARPDAATSEWQQVCQAPITVDGAGKLCFSSTPMIDEIVSVAPGRYVVEVAGAGFVSYGWSGSPTPGDHWRIRLWPEDGGDLLSPVRWNMPGYGVPRPPRQPLFPD